MKLRTLVFWPHLIAGVTVGVVILVMSVTGVLLTYERQLIAWSDRDYRSRPPSADAQPLAVEALLDAVRRERPDLAPTSITVMSRRDAPVRLAAGREGFYADAYSGAVLGEEAPRVRALMSTVRAWHRWLAVDGSGRGVGRAVTGWSNLLFLFIVVSGACLWIPRKWTRPQLRAVTIFGRGLRGKARDFNWHNVVGIWSAVPLVVVVLSALPISFPWAQDLVYRAVGDTAPGRGRGPGPAREAAGQVEGFDDIEEAGEAGPPARPLGALLAAARAQVPDWTTITLTLPRRGAGKASFAIDRGTGGQPQLRSTLVLDRATGALVRHEAFADQSPGRRLRSLMRFAHTGEVLGLTGQTIAGLASAAAGVLVWTGLALALRRLRSWIGRGRPVGTRGVGALGGSAPRTARRVRRSRARGSRGGARTS